MNRFGTIIRLVLVFLFFGGITTQVVAFHPHGNFEIPSDSTEPFYELGKPIYADIDYDNRLIYLLLLDGLWKYEVDEDRWTFLEIKGSLPDLLRRFEFAFNRESGNLLLWDRGIGPLYEIDLQTLELKRIDRSFHHHNQYGHYPFFYNGDLHAFGGYGMWDWHNIITFYNAEINEWNIVTVEAGSPYPEKRTPETGVFVPEMNAFYAYGGETPKDGRPDDKNVIKQKIKDIWKFSFKTYKWKKEMVLDNEEEHQFFQTSMHPKIGTINEITSSFYSSKSMYWYLPVTPPGSSNENYFLKPVHLPTMTEYPIIEVRLGRSKQFLVTQYLMDQSSNTLYFLGIDHLTNTSRYPINVYKVPEDTLRQAIKMPEPKPKLAFYIFGSVMLFAIVLYMINNNEFISGKKVISKSDLKKFKWLNDDEKRMMAVLCDASEHLESQFLEELVWPEIDNYDYRRKLRNDTINSINKKFSAEYPKRGTLIAREKDPKDNRRFLYCLNESISHE